MGLRRERKASAVPAASIDWAGEAAAASLARAEVQRVDDEARASALAANLAADPMQQLVTRCSLLEQRVATLEGIVGAASSGVAAVVPAAATARVAAVSPDPPKPAPLCERHQLAYPICGCPQSERAAA